MLSVQRWLCGNGDDRGTVGGSEHESRGLRCSVSHQDLLTRWSVVIARCNQGVIKNKTGESVSLKKSDRAGSAEASSRVIGLYESVHTR